MLIGLAMLIPAAAVAMYVWNPFNVPTWDPRARVLGVVPYRISSDAMEPTLMNGSFVAICTSAYIRTPPKVGDFIAFVYPTDSSVAYVKRVMAGASDSIAITKGQLILNEKIHSESYVQADYSYPDFDQEVVPDGHVFVLGDNRANSQDSRHFGSIATESVIGKMCGQLDFNQSSRGH
jgi:signal peptidase I